MLSKSILPVGESTIAPLTTEEETALNQWYDELDSQWLTAIDDPQSPEYQALVEMEAQMLAEQEYYHDQFLYADRLV
ncbi:hypothetical protein IQ264_04645 [Phormidium sp. LEGE 05292]|uniref:hypothetical protein n=1 Tax=[Phormidium] sp. LEGE 05292 TaxID=767427 RepID=UPI0018806E26|nr:hypothetical protein [Phormidium sp. LEGE 05292]MBE9224755.1 hypothetical protein [Phormidium sp. LEGE 05292]